MKKLICALALAVCASFAGAQVVEKGRTFADLTATHPCSAALDNRIARVTDCDAADDIGDGEGAFQCWAYCDGSAPWAAVSIGGGGGGLPGNDEVTEAMLKAVNSATDEYLLTYESTVGDFEWVQHAPTASALAANGANCGAGNYPLGVDASGAVEDCTALPAAGVGGSTGSTDNAILAADGAGGSTAQARDLTISDVAAGVITMATTAGNALTIDTTEPAATTGASVAGDPLNLSAGNAVASTDTAGAANGGDVTITAGNAARLTSGNANGGNINLTTGSGIGTGTEGQVLLTNSGTTAKPALAFAANTDTGIHRAGSANFSFIHSGTATQFFNSAGIRLKSDLAFGWSSADAINNASDVGLARSAAGVVRGTDGSSGIRFLQGGGTAVASATAMPLPTGRVFHVTGTTAITSITSTNFQTGVCITLIFDDVLTFTDGSNLKLAGDFVTSADDTISLCYDGTNWFETARAVN